MDASLGATLGKLIWTHSAAYYTTYEICIIASWKLSKYEDHAGKCIVWCTAVVDTSAVEATAVKDKVCPRGRL